MNPLNIKKIYYDLKSYLFGSDAFKFVYPTKNYEYPIDYSFVFRNEKFFFPLKDGSGIPYRVIGSEHHYIPSGVAGSALAYYNRYCKEKKLSDRVLFIRHAEWFLNFHDGLFPYGFKVLSIDPPWYSCLSQGLAASVLIRAYKLTGNNLYLDAAKKSVYNLLPCNGINFFSHIEGKIFLEEYPEKNPKHVFNGFMSALIGMQEYFLLTKDIEIKEFIDKINATFIDYLDKWSLKGWSLYSFKSNKTFGNFNTPNYHNLQISQLFWHYHNFKNKVTYSRIDIFKKYFSI